MQNLSKTLGFISIILLFLFVLARLQPALAQLGMPAPRCDETLDSQVYYEKYINASSFKTLHPSFNDWKLLPDNYDDRVVCINEDEKALLMWSFVLPTSLSKYQFSYKYQVVLVINWDKSAQLAHELTPEELITKVESLPEVDEFITTLSNELAQSSRWDNYWVGSSSYGESSGYVSPLQINYSTDSRGSIAVSENGVDWADLSIHENWEHFPTVGIGLRLAETALISTECTLDNPPTAVSRYGPRSRKNEEEPEEFIYNSYKISCLDNQYRYSMVNIYPDDGRFSVWLENREQISLGIVSESELENIKSIFSNRINENKQIKNSKDSPTASVSQTPDKKSSQLNLKLIITIATITLIIGVLLIYLLLRYKRKVKNIISEPVTINADDGESINDQIQTEQDSLKDTGSDADNVK